MDTTVSVRYLCDKGNKIWRKNNILYWLGSFWLTCIHFVILFILKGAVYKAEPRDTLKARDTAKQFQEKQLRLKIFYGTVVSPKDPTFTP